jgi:hypothetical protein
MHSAVEEKSKVDEEVLAGLFIHRAQGSWSLEPSNDCKRAIY